MRPIRYWSKTLHEPEKKLATTQKECLVVVWAVLVLRSQLEGSGFTVRMDQKALKWPLTVTKDTDELDRCQLHLLQFEIDGVQHTDVKNQAADTL